MSLTPDNIKPDRLSDVYHINSVLDFPVDIESGKYTLPQGEYVVNTIVPFSDKIDMDPGASLVRFHGPGRFLYTGAGPMFDVPDVNNALLIFEQFGIVDAVGDKQLLDIRNASGGDGGVIMDHGNFINWGNIGYMKECLVSANVLNMLYMANGMTIDSCHTVGLHTLSTRNSKNSPNSVYFTFQGDLGEVTVATSAFTPKSNESIFDIKSTSTINSGTVGLCPISLRLGGKKFATGSKDQSDPKWFFSANGDLPDSIISTQQILENNTLETDIPAIGAQVVINANTWVSSASERVVSDITGESRYIGVTDEKLSVIGNVNFNPAIGTTQELVARLFRIYYEETECTFNPDPTNRVLATAHGLSQNDKVSFWKTAGTLPSGIRKDIMYRAVDILTDSFKLAYVDDGTPISFTGTGTPPNTYSGCNPVGGGGRAKIGPSTPVDVTPFGKCDFRQDDVVLPTLENLSNDTNIDARFANYTISKGA